MKTIVALAISLLAAAPAIASETRNVARGVAKGETVRMAAIVNAAPAPGVQVVPAKKIRVVLASPYGN
ncbi:hypothetical protein [Methylobacterium sp. J-067]|uniref:hypothetical protein n=1 Tax=Methylobacterium sp. J-067 TaxID=2836648 RepID=UPI001FBB33EE|nr:hypothetical protein [Methylobacterium sp. J-067]MCJ2023638.1 hypothetical protein [Methylobacterium sp. J-067]